MSTRGKVRALLAGGLVLGVGAAVVLAAWNDSEFATGTFTAGNFNLQGSTDGTAFSDHAASPGAALPFTLNPDNLAPGDTVYAPFAVRLAANTSTGSTVTVNTPTATGSVANLSYQLIEPTSFGCSSSTTGTELVPTGTALDGALSGVTFTLDPGSPTSDPGGAVFLCFKVTAGAGLVQGQGGTATWQLTAASTS
ncbi:SipW-dependent-type signal peptide-containing protein [Arthrobacter sp. NyZ413]|uniref:SipW-dependent-type signal peptide-containing protein n=1 Tax=Arthrobacter sp. NyZ413 TaxID=3144669 RepID=UPI002C146E85|nr:SipW-dependent-type signal peptide-containing protein [Arthrobacter sp.]